MRILSDPTKINPLKWSEFVYNHPGGNIFQTPEIFKIYENSDNYTPIIICAENDEYEIIGVLLAVTLISGKGFTSRLTSRTLIIGGPLIIEGNIDCLNLMLSTYESIREQNTVYSQIRNFSETTNLKKEFLHNGFSYEGHLNILLKIPLNEKDLFSNYTKSRRKGVRKGLKSEFCFRIENNDNSINAFYDLLVISYKKIKLPYPQKSHFVELFNSLGTKNVQLFTLKKKDSYVAAMVGLIYRDTLYGYYMGLTTDNAFLNLRPSDVFFHHIFCWCIDNKINTFDWMGAGKPNNEYGVRDFKMQFGGNLNNYGRYQKIHKPLIYSSAKHLLRIWQRIIR